MQIIAADPTNSVYSGGSGRPYLVEGVGEDFWPDTYDPAIVDSTIAVTDAESFAMAHRVTVEEGILIGGSGGTAVAAALQIAENLTAQDLVVVLIPDSGRGYLSKVFDKSWMANMGFSRQEGPTIADLLDQRTKDQSELAYVSPESNLEEAISIMQERGLPGIPVANGEMPLAAAEVMGSVFQDSLLEESSKTDQPSTRKVQDVMGPNMPTVGVGESLTVAATKLENSQVLLVLDDGQPRSLLTRSDLAGSDI